MVGREDVMVVVVWVWVRLGKDGREGVGLEVFIELLFCPCNRLQAAKMESHVIELYTCQIPGTSVNTAHCLFPCLLHCHMFFYWFFPLPPSPPPQPPNGA